jgi:hypothetical protein
MLPHKFVIGVSRWKFGFNVQVAPKRFHSLACLRIKAFFFEVPPVYTDTSFLPVWEIVEIDPTLE